MTDGPARSAFRLNASEGDGDYAEFSVRCSPARESPSARPPHRVSDASLRSSFSRATFSLPKAAHHVLVSLVTMRNPVLRRTLRNTHSAPLPRPLISPSLIRSSICLTPANLQPKTRPRRERQNSPLPFIPIPRTFPFLQDDSSLSSPRQSLRKPNTAYLLVVTPLPMVGMLRGTR